jgi:hypothetical protein
MPLTGKVLLVLAFSGLRAAHAQISPVGATISLGGMFYFLPPAPVAQLTLGNASVASALNSTSSFIPFTFVNDTGSAFGPSELATLAANNSASDDVWSPSFLAGKFEIARVYSQTNMTLQGCMFHPQHRLP